MALSDRYEYQYHDMPKALTYLVVGADKTGPMSTKEKAAEKAAETWVGAKNWWDRYETSRESQGKAFPGRAAHAKALADRAARLNGK